MSPPIFGHERESNIGGKRVSDLANANWFSHQLHRPFAHLVGAVQTEEELRLPLALQTTNSQNLALVDIKIALSVSFLSTTS